MTNIVILSHGRLRLLQQAIISLYGHTDHKAFNLVIVSDSETDFRVTKYLRSLVFKNLSLLEVSNSGHVLSQLKNLGVVWSEQRFGRGDWLYLSDADVFFMPEWSGKLTELAVRLEALDFRLFGGQVHPFHRPVAPDVPAGWTEHMVLDGPSWLMRWETWDAVGPLDRTTAPGPCQSEEYSFCKRLTEPETQAFYLPYGAETRKPSRIGVIYPPCIIHTGLTNSNGQLAPGATERRALIPSGIIAE